MAKVEWWGTGRRKTSVARVTIKPGTGSILVNGRGMEEYFPREEHQREVMAPLRVTGTEGRYDVIARLNGGGISGQAGALSLGIARALARADGSLEATLKENKLLTRDPRMVERKKYGRHKARRSPQYSKR